MLRLYPSIEHGRNQAQISVIGTCEEHVHRMGKRGVGPWRKGSSEIWKNVQPDKLLDVAMSFLMEHRQTNCGKKPLITVCLDNDHHDLIIL